MRGVLVRQGLQDSLMAAQDLPVFTKLRPGRILQQQTLLLRQPFAQACPCSSHKQAAAPPGVHGTIRCRTCRPAIVPDPFCCAELLHIKLISQIVHGRCLNWKHHSAQRIWCRALRPIDEAALLSPSAPHMTAAYTSSHNCPACSQGNVQVSGTQPRGGLACRSGACQQVRLALEVVFEGMQGSASPDLGSVIGSADGNVLRVCNAVTLSHTPGALATLALAWEAGTLADTVADAVVAVIMQVLHVYGQDGSCMHGRVWLGRSRCCACCGWHAVPSRRPVRTERACSHACLSKAIGCWPSKHRRRCYHRPGRLQHRATCVAMQAEHQCAMQ